MIQLPRHAILTVTAIFFSLLTACRTPETPPAASPAASATPIVAPAAPGGLRTSASGLQYEDLLIGNGPRPLLGQSLQIFYVGRLGDGKQFDSGVFTYNPLKDKTIKGWKLGILGDADVEPMRVGGKRKLIIPPDLGYGSMETGPVPPNSTLIFELELKKVIDTENPFSTVPRS